ncbi:hypothetical protein RA970_001741 [Cronobacter dublinensis]|uniref:hypothetical protein n=1 Tax=Cronobacter dublinensis TaxID=413497 RepID=UPI00131A3819|nr:hypothetical protein [Cronobacter dublinensis]EKY3088593.1 hypothetical protein [Cronobacter dublinensis]
MSGLQCWDGSGRLIVDLGDYMVRYIGRTVVNAPAGISEMNVPYAGLTASGSFAAIVKLNGVVRIWSTSCYDGGFTLYFVPGTSYADTITVDLYNFL